MRKKNGLQCAICKNGFTEDSLSDYNAMGQIIRVCPVCKSDMQWTSACITRTTAEINKFGETAVNRARRH